jgi:hypothetical protein
VVTACMWQATRYDKGSPVGLISLTDFPFFWEGSVSYQVVYELPAKISSFCDRLFGTDVSSIRATSLARVRLI